MSAQFWYLGFWQGLALGMLLFLCSAGFTLVYSLMGILNFAHAAFFMLGAYIAFSVHTQFGFMVALLVAPVFVAALGAALEWGLLRRVHGQGHMAEMLLTFGLFLVVVEAVQLVWGRAPLSLDATALDAWIPRVEGIPLSPLRLALIGVGLLVWLGLCVLHSSRWGDRIQMCIRDRP